MLLLHAYEPETDQSGHSGARTIADDDRVRTLQARAAQRVHAGRVALHPAEAHAREDAVALREALRVARIKDPCKPSLEQPLRGCRAHTMMRPGPGAAPACTECIPAPLQCGLALLSSDRYDAIASLEPCLPSAHED
jgi:hypothetical protein